MNLRNPKICFFIPENGKDESILHPISFVYSLRDTHLIGPTIQDILVSTDGLAVQHMMQQIPL